MNRDSRNWPGCGGVRCGVAWNTLLLALLFCIPPSLRIALDAPAAARWLVALPLAVGAIGLLQARFRFCAAFGLAGVRNFGTPGTVERVEDAAARRADRAKAVAISLAGIAIGVAGALIVVLLPA